jgi:hypothetical protein
MVLGCNLGKSDQRTHLNKNDVSMDMIRRFIDKSYLDVLQS